MTTRIAFTRERFDWPQVSTAVFNLRPGCKWSVIGDEVYENLEWDESNEQSPPTKEEVDAEIQRISNDSAMKYLRRERDMRLYETDWWATSDRTMTQEQINYRQALRDITNNAQPILDPSNSTMVSNVNWPEKPN